MKKTYVIICALSLCALSNLGFAASSEWASSGATRMRLVVAEPQAGEAIIRAALQVELAPGWKTYWQDPGEAGVPLQLDLIGSQNVGLKAIHYPAPLRFDDGVTVWAGYKEPVSFPIEFVRTDGAAAAAIAATIFIGICEKICVPFQTTLSVTFKDASASTADQMTVRAAFEALPAPADENFGLVSMTTNGKTVQIETKVKDATLSPELFLAAPIGWQFGAPKLIDAEGVNARFEADIYFSPKEVSSEPILVSYTLLDASGAVTGISQLAK